MITFTSVKRHRTVGEALRVGIAGATEAADFGGTIGVKRALAAAAAGLLAGGACQGSRAPG